MELRINPEFERYIRRLKQDEYDQLEANILADGCRDPLVVWNGVIIDGHNRYAICKTHGLNFNLVEHDFESENHVKVWLIQNALGKRNLETAERIEYALAMKELLLSIGRERQGHGETAPGQTLLSLSDKSDALPRHNTQAELAKTAGVSTGMIGMAERVRSSAPELWEQAKSGDISVKGAYTELQRREQENEPAPTTERSHMNVLLNEDVEWYTPPEYIEAAKDILGDIELDPASNATAQKIIGAKLHYTKDTDGLAHVWRGKVWMNPPWGRICADFVSKLVRHYDAGDVTEAILLLNSNSNETEWFQPLWNHTLCFTRGRINYYTADGERGAGSTHGSVFVYLGRNHHRFAKRFAQFGNVVRRVTHVD